MSKLDFLGKIVFLRLNSLTLAVPVTAILNFKEMFMFQEKKIANSKKIYALLFPLQLIIKLSENSN